MKMNILKSKKDFPTRRSSGCFSFDEIVTFYTQTQNFLYVIEHYTTVQFSSVQFILNSTGYIHLLQIRNNPSLKV